MKLIEIQLDEVYNTKIPVERWTTNDNSVVGDIIIDGERFQIMIELLHYSFNSNRFSFLNIAFAKIISGAPSQELTITSKNASKILGAIFNAASDKVKELSNQYDIKAIVFVARDNVEKRMSVYNKMTSNLFNPFTMSKTNIPLPNGGKITALFHKSFDLNTVDSFVKYVDSLIK